MKIINQETIAAASDTKSKRVDWSKPVIQYDPWALGDEGVWIPLALGMKGFVDTGAFLSRSGCVLGTTTDGDVFTTTPNAIHAAAERDGVSLAGDLVAA